MKSSLKQRMRIASGAPWLGFDQLDFVVGPVAFVSLVDVPPFRVVLAVLPVVLLCNVAATTAVRHLGVEESWL